MKYVYFLIVLYLAFTPSGYSSDFTQASTNLSLGETDSLCLSSNGYFIHPLYNDVLGETDKLLTGAIKTGLLYTTSDVSLEILGAWQLFTPVFRPKNGAKDLPQPIGRYIDSMELKSSLASYASISRNYDLKYQVSFGLHHLGDKHGKNLHYFVHKLTRNRVSEITYTNQPNGLYASLGAFLGIFNRPKTYLLSNLWLKNQMGVGYEHGVLMEEAYASWNTLIKYGESPWGLGLEARMIQQYHSKIFDNIENYRHEFAVGINLSDMFKPSVKYISPYLKGDTYGQYFVDLINFYFSF